MTCLRRVETVAGRVFGQMIGPPWRLEHHSRMTGGRSWNELAEVVGVGIDIVIGAPRGCEPGSER